MRHLLSSFVGFLRSRELTQTLQTRTPPCHTEILQRRLGQRRHIVRSLVYRTFKTIPSLGYTAHLLPEGELVDLPKDLQS